MENYKVLKKYLKDKHKKCIKELFEDLYHDLLLKNLQKDIQYPKTYYSNGLVFLLLNNNKTANNKKRINKTYYERFNNYEFNTKMQNENTNELDIKYTQTSLEVSFLVPRDNNLFVKIVNEVERLPGKTKERIKEYLFGEMTISEIAKENNLNYDTTKATIKRGLDILRKRLQNER